MSLETIKERVEVARQHIYDLCIGKARWTMHVPVDMERDSDTIFATALANTEALLRVAEAAARDMENCAGCKADERGYCYRHNETGPTLRDLDALP